MKANPLIPWFSMRLRRQRWLVMFLMGVTIIIVEAWEHIGMGESLLTSHFISEFAFYGLTLPFLGAVLLSWLDQVERSRDQAEFELDRKHEFSRQLEDATTWENLIEIILQFPKTIFPVTMTHLYIKDPEKKTITLIASDDPEITIGNKASAPAPGECQSCVFWRGSSATLHKCDLPVTMNGSGMLESYCLPLAHQGFITGILRLFVPAEERITFETLNKLTRFAPEMALALENSRLQSLVEHQSAAAAVDRQRIAQDLHDSLGQNLSYLRLKLDQISAQSSLLSFAEIQKEIESMRDTANEAYLQMRGTLADLQPGAHLELEAAIQSHASLVGQRAQFTVEMTHQGQPVNLPAHIRRQLVYICREALNNVEKHAGAQVVKIHLNWGEQDLTINISDDGRGFDPVVTYLRDRYGINIMSERAAEINGSLSISSRPNQGTVVSLWLPLSVPQNAFEGS